MKKLLKKIAAVITTAAISLSAMVITSATAGADSIYDTATSISSGKAVSTTLYSNGDCADYKIKVTKNGELKLNVSAQIEYMNIYVYDENGTILAPSETNSISGTIGYNKMTHHYVYCHWNGTVEKIQGDVSYPVNKGDYYIRFEKENKQWAVKGNGNLSFTATFPSTTAPKAKISYLTLELTKGSSIKLGTVVTPTGSTVTWKSSNSSVATVSSTGKVTAKAKGNAIITAKSGTSTQKIKIIVT